MRSSAGAQPTGATEPSCCSLLSSASRPDEVAPCSRKVRGSGRRSAWGGAPPLLGRVSEPSRRCLGGVVVVSRVSEAQRQRLGGAEAASRSSPRERLATPRRARGAGRGSRRGRGPRRSRTCETRSRPPWTSASRATPRVECCAPSAAPSAAAPSAAPGPWSEPPVARRPRPKAGPAPRPEEASHRCAARRAAAMVLGAERWSENNRVPNATGSPADRPGPPESCRYRCAASASSSPAPPLLVPVPCRAAAAAHSRDRSAQLAAASLTAWTPARLPVRLPSSWRGAWRHGYHRPAGRSCPSGGAAVAVRRCGASGAAPASTSSIFFRLGVLEYFRGVGGSEVWCDAALFLRRKWEAEKTGFAPPSFFPPV